MLSQSVHFEWHFSENDATWADMATVLPPLPQLWRRSHAMDHWLATRLLGALLLCWVAFVATSGAPLTLHDRERIQATIAIQALLTHSQAGERTTRPASEPRLNSWQAFWRALQPPAVAAPTTDLRLLRVEPVDGLVLAEVLVNRPAFNWRLTTPYRETRIYRATENGWQAASLEEDFWGATQRRTSGHFDVTFFARDAAVVQVAFSKLEEIYPTLFATLGLTLSNKLDPWVIEITPEQTSNQGFYENRLRVTSPLLAQVPAELSAADYLTQRIARSLIYQVVNGHSDGQLDISTFDRWQPVRRGLRSWLQYELLAQRWPWDREAEAIFHRQVTDWLPLKLTAVTERSEEELTSRSGSMWQAAAAESIIAYAVANYGRERLPNLLQGMRRYRTWADLIMGVYGVSVAEFEAGWNQHVAAALE